MVGNFGYGIMLFFYGIAAVPVHIRGSITAKFTEITIFNFVLINILLGTWFSRLNSSDLKAQSKKLFS